MKQIGVIILLLSLLSSFTFAQTKLSAKVLKKIADATPKSLPQTPVAPKLTSDAQDENLRGKVKMVVEERENFTEIEIYKGRHFSGISEFDEGGSFIKEVYFDATGNPYEVIVYGYIDDFRAAKYQNIGDTNTVISLGTSQTETVVKKNKPDPRYDYKYEYKFTGRKLAEMQMIYNTGEKGMRYVYNYTGNQMEELVYTDKGKLNQQYLTVFDVKGYEIEWTNFIL